MCSISGEFLPDISLLSNCSSSCSGSEMLTLDNHQQGNIVSLFLIKTTNLVFSLFQLVEWTSLWSDSNAYFPIGPCEYGGPIGALLAGDTGAVFLLETPDRIPRHNIYELVWFLKTGFLRMLRMFFGLEKFDFDLGILLEGYQHYTP